MADEMIVVDDVDDHAGSLNGHDAPSPDAYVPASHSASTSAHAISGPATRRRVASASNASLPSDRATRSTTAKSSKPQPKLKLKLNDKAAHVSGMSFLGAYDRELDSDDEDLTFEEQFILRMPPGDDCDRLRRAVASREVGSDVWFKFKGLPCNITGACFQHTDVMMHRLTESRSSRRKYNIFLETRRPALYRRVAKDFGQQTDVQGRGHMSGPSVTKARHPAPAK